MIFRWLEKLGQFHFEIKHDAGKKVLHADCSSRVPTTTEEVSIQIVKTTDNSNNIWDQALKFPDLQLETVQLKSNE